MTTPMSPPPPLSETWTRAIRELEWRLAIADTDERTGPYFESVRNLRSLVDLTQQIAATPFGQSYRAGTSLRETLLISTAARHHLEPEDPYIAVSVERTERGTFGFCILYYGGGEGSEDLQALVKTYGTDDHRVIMANLRRDLSGFHHPCEYADAWETLQPLMVRLWDETHA